MEIRYVIGYLFLLSIVGFLMMGIDKWKAKKGLWRIPEKTIFLVAILGGSAGACLGMHAFRHKTKHWYFKYGLPAILMLQAAFAAWIYWSTFLGS
ncbi:MAG: hypothetical protein K0S60_666 [Evtepia sp.]|nr:hypothetical protein [Evtepia sp.]